MKVGTENRPSISQTCLIDWFSKKVKSYQIEKNVLAPSAGLFFASRCGLYVILYAYLMYSGFRRIYSTKFKKKNFLGWYTCLFVPPTIRSQSDYCSAVQMKRAVTAWAISLFCFLIINGLFKIQIKIYDILAHMDKLEKTLEDCVT